MSQNVNFAMVNANITSDVGSDIRLQEGGVDRAGAYQRALHDAELDAVAGGGAYCTDMRGDGVLVCQIF